MISDELGQRAASHAFVSCVSSFFKRTVYPFQKHVLQAQCDRVPPEAMDPERHRAEPSCDGK